MRLVLQGAFDRYSGYGNDAVDMAMALEKAGVDVVPMPQAIAPPLPGRFLRLLEKDPRRGNDMVLTFAPPDYIQPDKMKRMAPVRVGWTMWERTPFVAGDLRYGHRYWHDGPGDLALYRQRPYDGLDLLLVSAQANIEAFRYLDAEVPIDLMPLGMDGERWRYVSRKPADRDGPMRFLWIGTPARRKNVWALLEVWKALKADVDDFDAELHIHSAGPGLHPEIASAYGPGITVSNATLSAAEMQDLYASCDVLVSVSRGEGQNQPAMEFMATGGTVIATAWGGHENWLHRDLTFPLSGTLEPIERDRQSDPNVEIKDFAVNTSELRNTLLWVNRHRGEAARRGEACSKWIREVADWDVIVGRLMQRLAKM